MAASYPSAAKSFASLNDGDVIQDEHIEEAYDEIAAVEDALLNGFAHDLTFATDSANDIGASADNRPRDLHLARNLALGGVLTGAAQPRCRVYNDGGVQAVADVTLTALTFDSEDYDVGGFHAGGAPTRMTIPAGGDGLYLIVAKCKFAANGTGNDRILRITKNGAAVGSQVSLPADANNATIALVVGVEALVATDYIEAVCYQDSGGSLNVGAATGGVNRPNQNELTIVKLF